MYKNHMTCSHKLQQNPQSESVIIMLTVRDCSCTSFSLTNDHHMLKITVKTKVGQSMTTSHTHISPKVKCSSSSEAETDSNDTSFINAWRGIQHMAGLKPTTTQKRS